LLDVLDDLLRVGLGDELRAREENVIRAARRHRARPQVLRHLHDRQVALQVLRLVDVHQDAQLAERVAAGVDRDDGDPRCHRARDGTRFRAALGDPSGFPAQLAEFLERCREHGQTKPTPLLLRYVEGGYNRLHQDLYGPVAFPLQVACFLSRRGEDYTGGDFVLVESRPRSQSRVESIATKRGDAVVFTTRERPERGARGGFRRVAVRHGVSTVLSGERSTLGIIFHDAR
jgi:oxygenase catalysing oxidative methylation of damaged DNA